MKLAEQMAGRLVHELHAVPVFLRKAARRVNRAAGARGVAPVIIHLANLVGDRIKALAVRDGCQHAGGPAVDRFVIAIRNGHVHARIAVRRRAKDEIILGNAQAPRIVVAGTDELQLRAVGLETKDALPEPNFIPADGPAKTRIAHRAPNPIVETVTQIACGGMCVAHAPAGKEHTPFVRLVIAVGVLEEFRLSGVNDDDTAVGENKSGRDAQFVGENREFVGAPVAVGVLANLDSIMPLAGRLEVVWIIHRLRDPEATAFIPREPDGFHDVRLGCKQAHLEPGQSDQMFHRLGRFERLLHGADRFALRAPAGVRSVVGQRRGGLDIFKRLQAGARLELRRRILRSPANAVFNERLKSGVRPGAFIVAPGRVEHAPLPGCAHPGVRLRARIVATLGQHDTVGVVPGVNVSFVPALDRQQTLHHRMIGTDDGFLEYARLMRFELAADQFDVFRRI